MDGRNRFIPGGKENDSHQVESNEYGISDRWGVAFRDIRSSEPAAAGSPKETGEGRQEAGAAGPAPTGTAAAGSAPPGKTQQAGATATAAAATGITESGESQAPTAAAATAAGTTEPGEPEAASAAGPAEPGKSKART